MTVLSRQLAVLQLTIRGVWRDPKDAAFCHIEDCPSIGRLASKGLLGDSSLLELLDLTLHTPTHS